MCTITPAMSSGEAAKFSGSLTAPGASSVATMPGWKIEAAMLNSRPSIASERVSPSRPPLARRVGRAVLPRNARRDRADVEDSPAALALHHPERRAAAQERRGQVGADDLLPQLERHVVDRGRVGDPGVVDQHVDGAEARDGLGEQGVDRGLVGHVGGHRERFAAHRLEPLDEPGKPLGAPRREHDPGALATNATRRPRRFPSWRRSTTATRPCRMLKGHPLSLGPGRRLTKARREAKPQSDVHRDRGGVSIGRGRLGWGGMTNPVIAYGRWLAEAPRAWPAAATESAHPAVHRRDRRAIPGASEPARNECSKRSPSGVRAGDVIGTGAALAAPWAALVNGTAAHALDFDDNFDPAKAHATAVLAPAILALGEQEGASGADCLDAYIAGLQILGRTGQGVNPAHRNRGWHATATVGAIGAAAACARLLRLDDERAAAALSVATSMAAGFMSQFGTMTKPLHAGLAAKAGVLAASLARTGLTAGLDTLRRADRHEPPDGRPRLRAPCATRWPTSSTARPCASRPRASASRC
jgi:hypothetical protein